MMVYFICGMLFMIMVCPIVESLVSLIAQIIQWLCTIFIAKMYEIKKSLPDENEGGNFVQAIGFHVDPEPDEFFEEEEDE